MAIGSQVRKFLFQNASSGKIYEVVILQATDNSVSGVGRLLGTNAMGGDPTYDNTEISFVVITAQVGKVFGTATQLDSALHYAAYYDASNVGGAGAALSTLLV